MKRRKMLALTAMALASPFALAAAPDATQIEAVQHMLSVMQAEKFMRTIAGNSRYTNEAQRKSVMDKLSRVPAGVICQRLAGPVARFVSTETALEMSQFYSSPYGQRLLHQTYNGGPSMYARPDPVPTPAEKKDLDKPSMVKARKAMAAADASLRHEAFVLLNAISK